MAFELIYTNKKTGEKVSGGIFADAGLLRTEAITYGDLKNFTWDQIRVGQEIPQEQQNLERYGTKTPTASTVQPKQPSSQIFSTNNNEQAEILNWVKAQKPTYGTSKFNFDSREQMIEQGVANYGEQNRQFLVDTIYRELRSPTEPAYQPPSYSVFGADTTGSETTGIDPEIQAMLNALTTGLADLNKRGLMINPDVNFEDEPELMAKFLKQAETEIDPYYSTQLKLARESLFSELGYAGEEIQIKEVELERQYGKRVRRIGAEMAERGFAQSGARRLEEEELAQTTQSQIDAGRRALSQGAERGAREYAQLYGTPQLPQRELPLSPIAGIGTETFTKPSGTRPFYTLSPDIYEGLKGQRQYEQEAAKRTRIAELESDERIKRGIDELRKITL